MMEQLTKKYVALNEIMRYLESNERSRNMHEGESILDGQFLYDYGYTMKSATEIHILAFCRKTSALNDLPHEITGTLKIQQNELRVAQFMCSCKAGSPKCKHVAAVLIQLNRTRIDTLEQFSVTDVKCYWNTRKKEASARVQATPLEAFCHVRPHKIPNIFSSNQQRESFQSKALGMLLTALPNSAVALHRKGRVMDNSDREVEPHPEEQVNKRRRKLFDTSPKNDTATESSSNDVNGLIDTSFTDKSTASVETTVALLTESNLLETVFDNVIKSQSLCQVPLYNLESLQPCCRQRIESLRTSVGEAINICKTQQGTPHWLKYRKYRITGSTCHAFYTYGARKNDWFTKVNNLLINPPDISYINAVSHGIAGEKVAVSTYVANSPPGIYVLNTGIIVPPQQPWLGYSPDGIVMSGSQLTKLIEVKCPLEGKEKTATSLTVPYLVKLDGSNTIMKVNHPYYSQMQLGMAILDVPVCDLIVHATFDNTQLVTPIHRNDDFVKSLLTKLHHNYFKFMVHCFCQQAGGSK